MLRGGVGEKRKNTAADDERRVRQMSFKPMLVVRNRSSPVSNSLLDKLCSWQGLSAENLLSNFNSLVQTYVMGSVDLTSAMDGLKDDPSLLLLLIGDIIKEEDEFEFSPVEVRDKLRMIKEILVAFVIETDTATDEFITSVVTKNCHRRSFASSSSSSSSSTRYYLEEGLKAPPDQTVILPAAYTVLLPTVDYMRRVDEVEREMDARLHDYLLLKDATRFQNAVVVNAGHGTIQATRKSCDVFEIPTGKSVTIISAVNPGNQNFTASQYINAFLDPLVTKDYLRDHFFFRRESMGAFIVRHSVDVESLRKIMDILNSNYRGTTYAKQGEEADFKAWYTHHRPVSVKSFVEGDVAANRGIGVEKNESSPWGVWVLDEKIPPVSNVQKVAISLTPPTGGYGGFETDLNTVLNNVWTRGVDHITYFDFSCLPFEEKLHTSRARLSAEEAITLAGLAGGLVVRGSHK